MKNILRVPHVCNPALAVEDDPIRQRIGLQKIVGDKHDRNIKIPANIKEQSVHLATEGIIQSGKGLIEKEQFWHSDQCSGKGHSLFLTAGNLAWVLMLYIPQIEAIDKLRNESGFCRPVDIGKAISDILSDCHMGKKHPILKHVPHGPLLWRQLDASGAIIENTLLRCHVPFIRREKAGDHL